jgi:hypothetical protein
MHRPLWVAFCRSAYGQRCAGTRHSLHGRVWPKGNGSFREAARPREPVPPRTVTSIPRPQCSARNQPAQRSSGPSPLVAPSSDGHRARHRLASLSRTRRPRRRQRPRHDRRIAVSRRSGRRANAVGAQRLSPQHRYRQGPCPRRRGRVYRTAISGDSAHSVSRVSDASRNSTRRVARGYAGR